MTSHFPMSRPHAKNWCFTLNNYTPEEEEALKRIGEEMANDNNHWCKYLCFGRERGEQGTPHLQGCISIRTCQRMNWIVNKIWGRGHQRTHWEIMKGTIDQAANYCKKDGDYSEYGRITQAAIQNQWEDIRDMIKNGCTSDEVRDKYPKTWAAYRTSIESWVNEGRQARLEHYDGDLKQKNSWIWGPPGVGKSKKAREEGNSFYNKAVNKWWDGYNGEEVVILEDVDPERCKMLVHHMKIWLDRYIFTAEVKQSSTVLSPKSYRMIITSNYSPEECFNQTDLEAIRRRLHVIHMTNL